MPVHFEYIFSFFKVLIAALVGAFAAFRFNSMLDRKKREREISQFYLNICIENYEVFYKTLDGLNNNRVDWIYASRLLLETNELEKEITYKEHKRVVEVKKMKIRHDLYNQFQIVDLDKNTETPLPVSFFYGIDNWRDFSESPDSAAYEAFKRKRKTAYGEHDVSEMDRVPMLAENSVYVIFEFLSWPDNYDDPLSKLKYTSDWPDHIKYFQGEGAFKYIKHRQDYIHPDSGISKEGMAKLREMINEGDVKKAKVLPVDSE